MGILMGILMGSLMGILVIDGLDKDMGILWPYWQIFVRAEQAL